MIRKIFIDDNILQLNVQRAPQETFMYGFPWLKCYKKLDPYIFFNSLIDSLK